MPYATHGPECSAWTWPSVHADLAKGSSLKHFSIAKSCKLMLMIVEWLSFGTPTEEIVQRY